jgi:hypothetical protein
VGDEKVVVHLMGLTLVSVQRLEAQEFPKNFEQNKAHWKHHYDAALDALKKMFAAGTTIRPDDVASILVIALESDKTYKEFARKLPQKYWLEDVADYIVEKLYTLTTATG